MIRLNSTLPNYVLIVAYVVLGSICSSGAQAIPISVSYDNYVGGNPSNPLKAGSDVVGESRVWDIERAVLDYRPGNPNSYQLIIYSKAVNLGSNGAILGGDLFLSTDGYAPFGAAPHAQDNSSNGESWEYVLTTEILAGPLSAVPARGYEGFSALYNVIPEGIQLTASSAGEEYRANQEHTYRRPSSQVRQPHAYFWSLYPEGEYEVVRFTLPNSVVQEALLRGGTLGFHYTTSGGNDVIQGALAVPEPGSILLLGGAALGLIPARRRRSRQIA